MPSHGSGEGVLKRDHSVASGRTLKQIAEGKGKAPEPFMMTKRIAGSDAVWNSNKGVAPRHAPGIEASDGKDDAEPLRRKQRRSQQAREKARAIKAKMPDFAGIQLCETSARPPSADGWVHEIKFDGYRIQMRIEDGEVTLKTRKGLDWTDKFPAIAKAAAKLPDAIIDGEIVALEQKRRSGFLRHAGRAVGWQYR